MRRRRGTLAAALVIAVIALAGAGSISNNDIEHDLACDKSTPPPTGTYNAVDHEATGQCAALAGSVDGSASPRDSD